MTNMEKRVSTTTEGEEAEVGTTYLTSLAEVAEDKAAEVSE